jgi:hypothetical protein
VKLCNRALMILALLGLAGAAQARPSVAVGGGGCDASLTALTSLNAPDAAADLPRLSQVIGQRLVLQPSPGGFCVALQNDVGDLRSLTFDTNIELSTLDVLAGSQFTRIRINNQLHRVTTFDGQIRTPVMFIRVVGTSRTRVVVVPRRFRAHPIASSQP